LQSFENYTSDRSFLFFEYFFLLGTAQFLTSTLPHFHFE
jgi:hypothetical protein